MYRNEVLTGVTAPAYAQAMAARNLQLLQAIEATLFSVAQDEKQLRLMTGGLEEALKTLQNAAGSAALDPAGAVCAALNAASDVASRLYKRVKAQHESACKDFRLTPDDGVADAYGEYLAAIEEFHDAVETTREWIATHDAVLEPGNGKVFETVDELFDSLGLSDS